MNGHSMCDLLRGIRLRHPGSEKIYLVLDNAFSSHFTSVDF